MSGVQPMWGTKDMRSTYALAALAAVTAFASPAAAQSSDSIEARALLIQPATLQRVDDLRFGTIIATPAMTGNVTIDANDGSRALTGGLTGSVTDVGGRGRFIGNGTPGQQVTLVTAFPAFLQNSADNTRTVPFTGSVDSDGLNRTIGATGVFYVGVGGQIVVGVNQMPGLYTGQVTVTANFQ